MNTRIENGDLNFFQVNQKKAFLAATELNKSLIGLSNYIVMGTEPYVKKDKLCASPPGATTISISNKPRAVIFASNNINILKLENLTGRDCAVGLLNMGKTKIILVSLYLDIKLPVQPGWLKGIFEYANKKNLPVIFGVDSNCHSTLFGRETNKRGEELEELIINNSLYVENIGLAPTFQIVRNNTVIESIIDVTLSRGLTNTIQNWRVIDKFNGSDHKTIRFELNEVEFQDNMIRIWDNTDWHLFKTEISKQKLYYPNRINEKKLDKMVSRLYKVINFE